MKKLSLLFLTLCVSLAGWANESDPYRLNPFAYDLSSSWDEALQKLTLRFKVNSVPNLENTNGWSCGIQVFAVDSRGTTYYIWGTPGNTIRNAHNGGAGTYEYVADLSSGRDLHGNLIPRNEDLTWMVRVAGRGNGNSTPVTPGNGEAAIDYTLPRFWNFQNSFSDKRYISPSIAVNTSPETPNFGDIYIIDNMNPSSHTSTKWSAVSTGRGIYVYKPDFKTKAYSGKKVAITPTTKDGGFVDTSEPRDLCVSKDGRVFVCSYSTASEVAVWELKNNYTTWTPILNKEDITKKVTGGTSNKHSVVSIDVKGEGDNVTLLLLCKGTTKNNNNNTFPLLKCVEYNVSTKTLTEIQLPQQIYDFVYYNDGINAHARISYDDTNNWIWCGFGTGSSTKGGASYVRAFDPTIANDNNNVNKNLKVNETIGDYYGGEAFCVKGNMLIKSIQFTTYNRPSIIFRTIDRSKTTVGDVITDNPCFTYNGDVQNSMLDADFATDCYNDFALDYANNLYVANNWSGQVFPISLPYDGIKDTPAPSNQKFRLPLAVPNILATDLRYDIVRGKNQYEFSFNVNTKPQEAQIRFYESYDAMKNSLNAVNADNYDGTNNNKPLFVYNIPSDKLKQGRIAVTLGAVGGQVEEGVITNDRLPAGVLYWSVYVKTRESKAFAPIYEQSTTGEDAHHRLHATVNNYPETDGFGHIYAVNYYAEFDAKNGLMEYSFNPNGNSNDEQNNIKNSNRYKLVKNYLNPSGNKPKFTNQRRLAVAPDGKVYIADCGQSLAFDADADRPWMFQGGGVFVWNPNTQTGNEIQISLFSTKDQSSTATAVDIYNHNGQLKLYATNTYGEFENHYTGKKYWKNYEYTEANQANVNIYGWNGFKEFNLGTPNNILLEETTGTVLHSLGMGDGNGNIGIVATEKGIWMAQHRLNDVQYTIDVFKADNSKKPALPDNTENYILSFVPHGSNTRTWTSCSTRGINYSGSTYDQNGASELTQLTTSPLQACPGAGLAYRKTNGKEFLYIVNHQGNIVELQITSWTGTTPSVKYIKTYPGSGPKEAFQNTGRLQGIINTMCFDYAGNLITTSGLEYLGSTSTQNIIVYTMPYDRVNAREIQAPNSCRMIPERIAHLDMDKEDLDDLIKEHKIDHPEGCAIDLYRPLQGGMFNTICLPCTLDLKTLPESHPLYEATLREYTGLNLTDIGGEKILELVFTDVANKTIIANKPYIIQLKDDNGYNSIIRFAGPLRLTNTNGEAVNHEENSKNYNITYQGIIPYQEITPIIQDGVSLTLMLVADNRLAEMTAQGNMYGFRGYFELNQPLPKGMQTRITTSKGTATNTTIVVDGKKVNVEKFLREGRVYIRVGETLYTINGEKVE